MGRIYSSGRTNRLVMSIKIPGSVEIPKDEYAFIESLEAYARIRGEELEFYFDPEDKYPRNRVEISVHPFEIAFVVKEEKPSGKPSSIVHHIEYVRFEEDVELFFPEAWKLPHIKEIEIIYRKGFKIDNLPSRPPLRKLKVSIFGEGDFTLVNINPILNLEIDAYARDKPILTSQLPEMDSFKMTFGWLVVDKDRQIRTMSLPTGARINVPLPSVTYLFLGDLPTSPLSLKEIFPNLETLEISEIKTFEPQIAELMPKLRTLKIMDAHPDYLTQVNKIKELESLTLWYQQIDDPPKLINDLIGLKQLKELTIISSDLTSVPEEISQLVHLESLGFIYCKIKEIPDSIQNLTNLKTLAFEGNSLEKIPASLGSLTGLEHLKLKGGGSVKLPDTLHKLTNLKTLELESIPVKSTEFLSHMPNLRSLTIMNAQLKEVPKEIRQLTRLEELYLPYNDIMVFPKWLKELPIKWVNFRQNAWDRKMLEERKKKRRDYGPLSKR